jgi:hypothetical protein
VPLYLGRTASFLAEEGVREPAAVEERLDALGQRFEKEKAQFLRCWKAEEGG